MLISCSDGTLLVGDSVTIYMCSYEKRKLTNEIVLSSRPHALVETLMWVTICAMVCKCAR